ncbi:MAG: hypothetical protein ACRBFS_12850 [Aureispira sp.]
MSKGLEEDYASFRMTVQEDKDAPFPTMGTADSFTLAVFDEEKWAGVVSFARELFEKNCVIKDYCMLPPIIVGKVLHNNYYNR